MQSDWRIWALGSAFFAALTAILAKVGVAGVSSNLATVVRTVVILVFGTGLVWMTGEGRGVATLGARTLSFLVLSGLATGLSWLCYFRALQLGEAAQVAPVDKLSVVFVMVLAAAFLGEKLSWHQWLGGGLILAGAVVIAAKST
jgi:transporter family protein